MRFEPFQRDDSTRLVDWLRATPLQGLGVPPAGSRWVEHLLSDPNVDAFMAKDEEGTDLGFARVNFLPDRTAEITVIVDPRQRRRGVGAALVGEAVERCRRRGRSVLAAICARTNRVARKFFEAAAFRPAKTQIEGFDRLELWLHESNGKESPLLIEP
jgi:GNAT superfamily N-acetyltransferase